jgi:hypothetical protein
MYTVPHSHKNIFIQEQVETLYYLNTRMISLELLRIPTPESAPIPQFTHHYRCLFCNTGCERPSITTPVHPSPKRPLPTSHQCFDPRSDDCVVFCRKFAIPGECQTPNPLITNVGAYLCGSDIQMIQKRFPDPEDFQE